MSRGMVPLLLVGALLGAGAGKPGCDCKDGKDPNPSGICGHPKTKPETYGVANHCHRQSTKSGCKQVMNVNSDRFCEWTEPEEGEKVEVKASAKDKDTKSDHFSTDPFNCYHQISPFNEQDGDDGKSYRGLVSQSGSGRTCQTWGSTHPWKEAAENKPEPVEEMDIDGVKVTKWGNGLGNHNYCRNPDGSRDKPWCYTEDPNEEHKKENCDIMPCPPSRIDFKADAKDLANTVASGLNCKCAAQLYGDAGTTKETAVELVQWGKDGLGRPCRCRASRTSMRYHEHHAVGGSVGPRPLGSIPEVGHKH